MPTYKNAVGATLSTSASYSKGYYSAVSQAVLTGTSANEGFRGSGGTTMSGGAGDDTYIPLNSKDIVIEAANGGIDTVVSHLASYTLGVNVENLTLGTGQGQFGTGNGLDNILTANGPGQTLDGGAGNDVLIGANTTTFVIGAGNGSDAIYNWNATDTIRLSGYGVTSFSQVQQLARQVGQDTQLDFANGEKLVLNNVQASSLSAGNFQLSLDRSGMKQTFADEFDSLSLYSSKTKTGTWSTDFSLVGTRTMVGHTIAGVESVYVDKNFTGNSGKALGLDPFSLKDGLLTITTAPTPTDMLQYVDNRSYTGGLLTTRGSFAQEYGYFEIRAAMPAGQGLYSAFWMLPTDGSWPPELDVFEVLGKDPNSVMMTSHDNAGGKNVYTSTFAQIDTTKMHTYGVDWGPDQIKYFIDGTLVATQATPASMHKEMYMLVNLGTGTQGGWIGGTDSTTGAGKMQIDYIRAYQTADTVSTTINNVHTAYTPVAPIPPADATAVPVSPPPVVQYPPAAIQVTAPVPPLSATIARDDSYVAIKNGTLAIAADKGLFANDTHDASASSDAVLVHGPAHGVVKINDDGSFTYTPTAGYTGADSFTYAHKDASGHNGPVATASVNVVPGVIAHDDGGYATAYGKALTISAPALLANDNGQGQNPLTLTGVGDAKHGSVALVNGQAVFTPEAFYSGSASFEYTVTDAAGNVDHATVSLAVGAEAKPASLYIYATAGADMINKSASSFGWMINANSGNDTVLGGNGTNSLGGGAGNDILVGGAANDTIAGGVGADVMTGGGGNDTFLFAAGDLTSIASGKVDRITDFHPNGTGSERDVLRFTGFGAGASLSLSSTNADGSFTYHVNAGASSGDIVIQSQGHKLGAGDFYFA